MVILSRGGRQVKRNQRIVGFDCAEDEHSVVLLDASGEFGARFSVINSREQVQELLAELILEVGPEAELVVVVESKRSHGRIVTDVAVEMGCEVWQVNTVALNHFRDLEGQPRKDDEWDAYLGARMVFLRMGGCREVIETTEEERTLSRLTRTHSRLVEDRKKHVTRLRAVLLELAPEMLHSSWKGPRPGSKALLYLLERWPGFEGLEKAQLRTIEKILRRCRYGSKTSRVAKLIRSMARRISISGEERSALTLELDLLAQQIRFCNESVDQVYGKIARRVERHPIGKKLLEMHGNGPVIVGVLISELYPVARASSEPKCATYAGVTPLARKSGKSLDNDKLAQGVNKRVLHALYTSAVVAVKNSAIDRAYYQKKFRDYAGHPKPHVAAFIALARQRHKLVYKLMTTEVRYDKEILIATHLARLEQTRQAAA
jgi:transposase